MVTVDASRIVNFILNYALFWVPVLVLIYLVYRRFRSLRNRFARGEETERREKKNDLYDMLTITSASVLGSLVITMGLYHYTREEQRREREPILKSELQNIRVQLSEGFAVESPLDGDSIFCPSLEPVVLRNLPQTGMWDSKSVRKMLFLNADCRLFNEARSRFLDLYFDMYFDALSGDQIRSEDTLALRVLCNHLNSLKAHIDSTARDLIQDFQ